MRALILGLGLLALFTAPASAILMDAEPTNNTIAGTGISVVVSGEISGDFGLFSLTPGNADFIGLSGLSIGDVVTVTTTPLDDPLLEDPDTIVGLFTAGGGLVAFSDDTPNDDLTLDGLGSLVRYVVDEAGELYVGISGFGDDLFVGGHSEDGQYVVSLTVFHREAPEPAVLGLLAGAAGLLALRRRSLR